jgi:hypothetical protein
MLLVSAPLLIDANVSRTFLETAERLAAQLSRALRAAGDEQARQAKVQLNDGVVPLRQAAAPLLQALNRDERAARAGVVIAPVRRANTKSVLPSDRKD